MTPPIVFTIWTVTLVIVTFLIVPVALYLLHRTLRAAISIERYARESLEAGVAIASNTKAVEALAETVAAATALLESTQKINAHTAGIAAAVGRSSTSGGER